MSTVADTPLLDTPIEGAVLTSRALEQAVGPLIEAIVLARRQLAAIRAERHRAAEQLAHVEVLHQAERRVGAAESALEAYVAARVEGPIP